MGGGNAFLRFSSSVAAGALILPQVARAQTTCVAPESPPGVDGCCAPVKTYEGCGSCEDPTLRLLTTVESSSDSLTTSTTFKYTSCSGNPFSGTITLQAINSDITALRDPAGDNLNDCTTGNDDVSVVSFPCITESPLIVVEFDEPNALPSLQKIRFANLVRVGEIRIQDLPALISIFAPLLQRTSFSIAIQDNNLLPKIDLPSLSEAGVVQIQRNENLKKISLPQLTTANNFFFVYSNPNVRKLCASKLESVGDVCIGNDQNQPFLDADLSELVTGSFFGLNVCYQQDSNAPTVCGAGGTTGVFSDNRCPSNACS